MKSSETYPDMFQNSDYYSDKEKDDLPDYYSGFNFFDKDFIFEDQSFSSEIFTTNDKPFGLKKSSSDDDIKKKYRELILKFHPDKGGDEEEFKKIQGEWEKYQNRF